MQQPTQLRKVVTDDDHKIAVIRNAFRGEHDVAREDLIIALNAYAVRPLPWKTLAFLALLFMALVVILASHVWQEQLQ